MGFYDFRCAVTGVSLRGSDAVLVGLRPVDNGYRPVTLGIAGTYDRLGSIDGITEDLNTRLVLAYFRDRARSGEFVPDPDHAKDYGNPPHDIERLLRYFERNVSERGGFFDENPAATLFGQRIFSALIAEPVWTALAAEFAPRDGTPDIWFQQIFGDSPVAEELYRDRIPEVAAHIRELAAVDVFLATRGLAWTLPDEDEIGSQHFEEMRAFLDTARVAFGDVPAVLAALGEYAEEARDLLNDDD